MAITSLALNIYILYFFWVAFTYLFICLFICLFAYCQYKNPQNWVMPCNYFIRNMWYPASNMVLSDHSPPLLVYTPSHTKQGQLGCCRKIRVWLPKLGPKRRCSYYFTSLDHLLWSKPTVIPQNTHTACREMLVLRNWGLPANNQQQLSEPSWMRILQP